MKNTFLFLALLVLVAAAPAWAQTAPTPRFDQYAILTADDRPKNRAFLELLTGTAAFPTPTPSQQTDEAARVKAFEYEADALNYLSSRGWEVISVSTTSYSGNTHLTRYHLRRRGGQ